ncbi:MAG TPA: RodZ domain-containing protein [Terriglobales bacterium]|nr:RodZ domain-containing protein [Terriglobales bacterium]
MKKAREKRGITLDDVALTTKIGTRFLRAMEEEHFDQLPGGIFNRGFVRAYARCVGLDEDQAVADYLTASGEAQPKKAETAEPAPVPVPKAPVAKIVPKEVLAEKVDNSYAESGDASNFPWILAAAVVVVAALGMAIWRFYPRQPPTGPANITAAAVSSQPATPVSQSSVAQTTSSLPVTPSPVPTSSPAPGAFVVLIKAAEESWMSIKVDDQPAAEYTLEESEQKSIEAHKQVEVKVGNLAGVDFSFNGKNVALQGEEGEVKTLIFDTNGLRPAAPKSQSPDTPAPTP